MSTSALVPPVVIPASPAPIAPRERIGLIDALRSFALFGVLMSNLSDYTGVALDAAQTAAQFGNGAAAAVHTMIVALFEGKFYSIFSLLFGLGFALQLARLEREGAGGAARYVRRLVVLLGFGLAHHVFLYMGDILTLYAMLGLVLLLFRRMPERRLLVWAVCLTFIPVAWSAAIFFSSGAFRPWMPFDAAYVSTARALLGHVPQSGLEMLSPSSYAVLLRSHIAEISLRYGNLVYEMRFAKVLAMFLVGLWVGRKAIAAAPEAHRALLVRVCRWSFAVGIPASVAMTWCQHLDRAAPEPTLYGPAAALFYALSVPTLALAYASGFALLWPSAGARRWLDVFAPAGRMTLTNYLLQSVISLLIFTGVGLGLVGKLSVTWVPVLAVAIIAVQVWYSRWWLARYRFGPAEWLWRTLTYGHMQPMRRPALEPEEAVVPALAG